MVEGFLLSRTSVPTHPENWLHPEERFRLLVDGVKDHAIFMLDRDGRIASWNEGAQRLNGYTADEAIGTHFSRFYPPEQIAAGKPAWELERAIADGRVEDEGWRLRKDGSRFWADVVITALFDPVTKELRGFGKVTRDLTERKMAEEHLRQSEEQFRLLVESVDEYAIFLLNPEGHVMTWNPGAHRAKGYTADEIIGQYFGKFYTPEDQADGKPERFLQIAAAEGHVRDQGFRVRRDGSLFMADVLITAVHGSDGKLRGFSKITRDITDQIRAREIEAARIAAEQANRAKDEFLAVLSHELRTPLTPVVVAVNDLVENLGRLREEEILDGLGTIQRNVRLEAQLIDDLLDLTRISRGKIELRQEAVDLHGALIDVLRICEEDAVARHLQIHTQFAASEHWCWADPTRIRQVVWNLLNNAVKFTPDSGEIWVLSSTPAPGRLAIEVTDTGVGIEPEQMARIFDAFEQGERMVTRQFGGLGLGLTISRRLVELHGGTIVVQSAGRGKGATFRLEFAAIPTPPETERPGAPKPGADEVVALDILLVDDHVDTRRVLSRLLSRTGHRVQTAASVVEATKILEGGKLDVLISDIGLPDGSGYDLMRAAREKQPHIRGIAVSGFGMHDDIRRSEEAGFSAHLTKPLDIEFLVQWLTEDPKR